MITDWAQSGRQDLYDFALVNPFTLQEVGTIDVDAKVCSMTWALDSENLLSGSIAAIDDDNNKNLVRVKHTIKLPNGEEYNHTLGTMFVDYSGHSALYKKVETDMNCYSTLWRFSQDKLHYDFFRQKGYNVVQAIQELVEEDGGKLKVGAHVDTARTFGNDIGFEMETNKLEAIRTLAYWINCEIGVDPDGYVTINGVVPLENQAPVFTFESGINCAYLPGLDLNYETDGAVNRVIAYYTTNDASDYYMAELHYAEPYSYDSIGRHVTYFLKFDEPKTQEELQEEAEYYLHSHKGTNLYFEIEHPYIPQVEIGKLVRYINDTDYPTAINEVCVVLQMDMSLNPGGMCKTKLQVVS